MSLVERGKSSGIDGGGSGTADRTADREAPSAAGWQRRGLGLLLDNGVLLGFILLVAVLSLVAPYFFTRQNLLNILLQSSPYVLLGLAELLVVLVAGIDLSVGSLVGLSGAIYGYLIVNFGVPWPLALVLVPAIAFALGLLQGVVINYFNVTDFITTLGGLSVFRGLTLVITQGNPISNLPAGFDFLGQGAVLGVPFPVVIMAAGFIGVLAWLGLTVSGIHIYGVGGSRTAAYRSGIKVRRLRSLLYGAAAALSAVAGAVVAARLGTAEPTAGTGYELTAIAAVVVGGASLFGGRGNAWGALLGALVIGTILNGLTLLNVSPFYTQMVEGLVVVAAVMLDNLRLRGRRAQGG